MKTIIEMAREAKLLPSYEVHEDDLQRFAALVRADEREACAVVCETTAPSQINGYECAEAIRARGNT